MKTSMFAQFAAEASRRTFVGELVKFTKGEWLAGTDRDPIPTSRPFVAAMDTLTIGYIKWVDGKPVDSRMGLVADGFRPAHRNDLDDLDSMTWRVGEDGARDDPWQKTTLIVLCSADEPHDLYTFATSTSGGQSAISVLCEAHARSTEDFGQYPVIMLDTDAYQHKIKAYGRIKVPIFKIVDCVEAAPLNAMVAEARGGAGFIPASMSSPALVTSHAGPIAIVSSKRACDAPPSPGPEDAPPEDAPEGPSEFDDDIPF